MKERKHLNAPTVLVEWYARPSTFLPFLCYGTRSGCGLKVWLYGGVDRGMYGGVYDG